MRTLFGLDANNRMTSVTEREGQKTSYSYDDLGCPTGVSYPNGAGDAYAYNPLDKVTSATATGANNSVLSKLSYSYYRARELRN